MRGYGNIIGIDAELVVPNNFISVRTLYSLGGESMSWFREIGKQRLQI
jgi:excinuclease ABC subunit A